MLRRLIAWMAPRKPVAPDPLTEAKRKREAAWKAWTVAKSRNDCRDIHSAFRAFKDATSDVVRLELGR